MGGWDQKTKEIQQKALRFFLNPLHQSLDTCRDCCCVQFRQIPEFVSLQFEHAGTGQAGEPQIYLLWWMAFCCISSWFELLHILRALLVCRCSFEALLWVYSKNSSLFHYTSPWQLAEIAAAFMWGLCEVVAGLCSPIVLVDSLVCKL